MKFTILGNPIPKKNSMQVVYSHGHPVLLPPKNYTAYAKGAKEQLRFMQFYTDFDFPIDTPVNVCCVFYRGDRRRVDLPNLLEGTLDILVEAKVLHDDNCKIVYTTDGSMVLYDKDNPRVEVEITPVTNYEGF